MSDDYVTLIYLTYEELISVIWTKLSCFFCFGKQVSYYIFSLQDYISKYAILVLAPISNGWYLVVCYDIVLGIPEPNRTGAQLARFKPKKRLLPLCHTKKHPNRVQTSPESVEPVDSGLIQMYCSKMGWGDLLLSN